MALLLLIGYTLLVLAVGVGATLLLHREWCKRPLPMVGHAPQCLCVECRNEEIARRLADKAWNRRQEEIQAAVDETDKL